MESERQTALTFAKNLQRLMDHHGLSQNELAKRSGVGQRTLSTLLDQKRPLEMNPRSTTIQQLAEYFDVPSWILLIPDLPLDLLTDKRLAQLVERYRDSGNQGRESIDRVAEMEARYSSSKPLYSKAI